MLNVSDANDEKKKKLAEIKNIIREFSEDYLNTELEGYCLKLADTLGRKRKINILRSKSEQWAASIIYIIARLNFLFDQKSEFHITTDDICNFFNTVKSTTGNKATQIEQLCNISMGEEGYCSEEISDMFIYYETESGFIISKSMLDRMIEAEFPNELEEETNNISVEPEESILEKRRREKEKHLATLKEKADKRAENKDQLGLFDN